MFTRTSVLAAAFAVALLHGARAEEPKKEPDPKPPTFEVPKGWETERDKPPVATVTVAARFRAGEGDKAASVTLIGLPGNGGGLAANVNRWRGQVGLKELDEKDALKSLEPIKVDGLDGHVLDVTGPEVEGKVTQRVRVAVVARDGYTWYVRMGGPAAPVGDQKKAFDEFVKSIRFAK
jgi:hypothetical protein